MIRIQQGLDNFNNPLIGGMQQSDTIYAIVLAANTPQYLNVPAGATLVLFSVTGGSDFWMKLGATAGLAVPSASITDGTAPELNPLVRQIGRTATIGLVSAAACTVMMAFYN